MKEDNHLTNEQYNKLSPVEMQQYYDIRQQIIKSKKICLKVPNVEIKLSYNYA